MSNILPPPLPNLTAGAAWTIAIGATLAGAGLLLWGRLLGRAAMTLSLAVGGWVLGGLIAQWIGLPQVLGSFALLVAGAVFGLMLSATLWVLLAGGLAALAAAAVAVHQYGVSAAASAKPANAAAQGALNEWAGFVWQVFGRIWQDHSAVVAVMMGAAAAAPLLIGLLRPRSVQLLTSVLVGAAAIVVGLLLAVVQFKPLAWSSAFAKWYVPAATAGLLATLGVVVQGRAALSERRAKKAQEQKKSQPPAAPAKAKAGKKA